jgi:hypothetical protein
MKATIDLENKPTITFCLKNDFEFPKKFQDIEEFFDSMIWCKITYLTD